MLHHAFIFRDLKRLQLTLQCTTFLSSVVSILSSQNFNNARQTHLFERHPPTKPKLTMTEEAGSWANVGSNETNAEAVIQVSNSTVAKDRVHELESNLKTTLEKVSLLESVVKATVTIDSVVTKAKAVDYDIVEDVIKNLFRGAKGLDMPELRDKAVAFAKQLNDEQPANSVWFLAIYDKYEMNNAALEKQLMSHIQSDPPSMLAWENGISFGLIGRDRIVSLVSDETIDATELTLFEIISCWVKHGDDATCDAQERVVVAKTLVDGAVIDLSLIETSILFSDKIRKSEFVSDSLLVDTLERQNLKASIDNDVWNTTRATKKKQLQKKQTESKIEIDLFPSILSDEARWQAERNMKTRTSRRRSLKGRSSAGLIFS